MARNAAAEGNKSEAIRSYKKSNRKAKPREIAAALQEQGFDVNAQYVSVVLSNARKNKAKRRDLSNEGMMPASRGRKPGRPTGSSGSSLGQGIGISELKLAKQLMISAGGAKQARMAIDAISQLLP